jgi:hypothetical protein
MAFRNTLAVAAAAGIAATSMAARPAHASEALFGYLYTTEVMPAGAVEVEQWVTDKIGQENGHFNELQLRTEIEFGVTDRFQVAGYLNTKYQNETAAPGDAGLKFDGFSFEAIWQLMNPYKDSFGLALYAEPSIAPDETEFEFKLLAQKNLLDGRLVLAANAVAEWVVEDQDNITDPLTGHVIAAGGTEKISELQLLLGASYRVAPNWFLGAEYRYVTEFEGLGFDERAESANYIGPTVHFAKGKWFATLTWLTRFGANDYGPQPVLPPGSFEPDVTTNGLRLKVGVSF